MPPSVPAMMRGEPGLVGEPGSAPAALTPEPWTALLSGRLLRKLTCFLALLAAEMAASCSGVWAGAAAVASMIVRGVR
jgi:hypothetical protein